MIARALMLVACLARAQDAAPALVPGVERRAELAPGGEAALVLEVPGAGAWTVQAGSLDFDLRLAVELEGGGERREDRRSWGHSDAWLVFEAQAGSRWRVVVAAEDGRGGEYGVTVREGRFDPPKDRRERILAAVEHCERISARAESRGEIARAARHAGIAAEAAFAAGEFELSARAAERELALAEAGALEHEAARAALNLGAARRMLGELEGAIAMLERARPGIEESLAEAREPRERTAAAMRAAFLEENLADLLRAQHGPARALPSYEAAAAHAAGVPNARFAATAELELVKVLTVLGRTRPAREALERAQALARTSGDDDLTASCLLGEARLEIARGRPAHARELLQRALELVRMPLARLDLLGTLAGVAIDLGRHEEAERAMDELERLADESTRSRYELEILKNRALIARLLGDDEGALRLCEQAIERSLGRGATACAESTAQLAAWHAAAGREESARALAGQALAWLGEVPGLPSAPIWLEVGSALQRIGDLGAAWEAYEHAGRVAREHGHERLVALAESSSAYVVLRTGGAAAAVPPAARSAAALEALGDLPRALDAQDTLAKAALAQGDLAGVDEALCDAERLIGELTEAPSSDLREAQVRSRFAEWGQIAQELAVRRAADPDRRLAAFERAQAWKAHVLLERRAPRGAASASAWLAALPEGTVVVDFAEGLERMYAWVAARGALELVDLGRRDAIAADAAAFADRILDLHASPREIATLGARLYELLVDPLRQYVARASRSLVLVPSPLVASLPFDALVLPESMPAAAAGFTGLRYLIDEVAISYAPSALLLEPPAPLARPRAGTRVLILGDPTTRDEFLELGPRTEVLALRAQDRLADLVRLTKTRDEALDLAALVLAESRARGGDDARAFERSAADLLVARTARDVALETGPFDLYLGRQASAERLLGASGYGAIHVAAHGHVDPLDPRRSGLVLAWEERSGGLVTLEELASSRLDAGLVVLSACETAGGRIVRGEGVQSVAYAFLLAGAKQVVATLWRVGDIEASQMMRMFHAERMAGPEDEVAAALRRAKLSFRLSSVARGVRPGGRAELDPSIAHPRFWAGYVAIAAPR